MIIRDKSSKLEVDFVYCFFVRPAACVFKGKLYEYGISIKREAIGDRTMDILGIGENILKLRRRKGITQEALAEFVGVTKTSVSKWETGGSLR